MGLEFAVGKSSLNDELSKMLSVLQKKASIPILECIKIESDGQALNFTTTNMESTLYSRFESKLLAVTQQGKICLPAKNLSDRVRLAPDGPIKITGDDNHWVHIIAKGSRAKVPGMDPASWPDLPKYDAVNWIDIPAPMLKTMLPGIKYAISNEESRRNLRGAQLEIDASGIRLIATDAHRISLASATLEQGAPFAVLIPVEGVDELIKLVSDQTGSVGIGMSPEGNLFFRSPSKVVCTRLMVDKFPNYQLPLQALHTYPYFGTFKSEDLILPIKRAMLCSKKEGNSGGVALRFEPGQLRISAADADLGEAEEILQSNFNHTVVVPCSGKFLTDYLDSAGPEVRIEIKDPTSQFYMISEKAGVTMYGMLMPLRQS